MTAMTTLTTIAAMAMTIELARGLQEAGSHAGPIQGVKAIVSKKFFLSIVSDPGLRTNASQSTGEGTNKMLHISNVLYKEAYT